MTPTPRPPDITDVKIVDIFYAHCDIHCDICMLLLVEDIGTGIQYVEHFRMDQIGWV